MDLSWIFLALFLVAIVGGILGSLSKSMLKNLLRLASTVVAFSIVLLLQVLGVFQDAVNGILSTLDFYSMLPPEALVAGDLVGAIISTVVSSILIVIAFLLILWVLRIIIHFVVMAIEHSAKVKNASPAPAENADNQEIKNQEPKPENKKALFTEEPWKIAVSAVSGLVSSLLLLSVLLTPMFYVGSLAGALTHATDDSDATDSKVYQALEVVETHLVVPYENNFVINFYDALGLSGLMNYTTSRGGKIVLEDGATVYADDVLKKVASHAINAVAEITSLESECAHVKGDIDAIVNDPVISLMLTDVVMGLIEDVEVPEVDEEDLMSELTFDVISHYKEADRATVEADLHQLGGIIGVLAKDKVIIELAQEDADLAAMIKDEKILDDVIESISVLSSFPPIIEDAFSIGVNMAGEAFQTPHDDAEVYDIFVEDLLSSMVKQSNVKFDENTIKYYVYTVAKEGKKVSASNGIKGHSTFIAYTKHWSRVHSAFAHAAEDKSYGYFTIEISGKYYIYDHVKNSIVVYSEDDENIYENYKNKISPVAGLINALALRSRTTKITPENLNTILTAYAGSAKDTVSVDVARRMLLGRDGFTSEAVTIEKMLDACDFSAWSDPEVRKEDSHLYVGIIIDLLEVMETLDGIGDTESVEDALDLVDEFVIVGEAMDFMQATSCTKKLPDLLVEALIKGDLLSDYISPDIAFKNIEIVQNHENQTYENCMRTVATNIKFAISFAGGIAK